MARYKENKLGQQCTAKAKTTGERCTQPAKTGGKVCHYHGGKAPQVERANARRIIEALVGPALTRIGKLIEDGEVPSAVQLAAARDMLDRAGYKPVDKSEIMVLTDEAIAAEIARLKSEQ